MAKLFERRLILLMILILPIAILGSLYLLGFVFWPAEPPPLPSPNGYDKLIDTTDRIEGNVFVAEERDPAELAEFIHSNREALRLIREALKEESQVPVVYNKSYYDDQLLQNLVKVKLLGILLSKEGKLAELRGEWDHALECYLDQLKLARHVSRGGLIVDHLTGAAIEFMGLQSIAQMAPELSPGERQRAIKAIKAIDSQREPVETVIARDQDWSRRAYSIADKLKMMWGEKTLFPRRSTDEKVRKRLSQIRNEYQKTIRTLPGTDE